ncbi:hypothetical protein ACLOJK_032236 [Asimina triloba]
MVAGISAAVSIGSCGFSRNPVSPPFPRPNSARVPNCLFLPSQTSRCSVRLLQWTTRWNLNICLVVSEKQHQIGIDDDDDDDDEEDEETEMEQNQKIPAARSAERSARKQSERVTYLIAAMMSSFGITSMAIAAVYYRFWWQMEGGEVPYSEMFGTFALSVGAAVSNSPSSCPGEFELNPRAFSWEWSSGPAGRTERFGMRRCGTCTREGPFELNDVFAITNAVPAIGLLSYGFFNKGLVPGLCFGAVSVLFSVPKSLPPPAAKVNVFCGCRADTRQLATETVKFPCMVPTTLLSSTAPPRTFPSNHPSWLWECSRLIWTGEFVGRDYDSSWWLPYAATTIDHSWISLNQAFGSDSRVARDGMKLSQHSPHAAPMAATAARARSLFAPSRAIWQEHGGMMEKTNEFGYQPNFFIANSTLHQRRSLTIGGRHGCFGFGA